MQPENDLEAQAKAMLAAYGPVYPGTPHSDFSVIHLDNYPGWVVTCHHNDILTYVGPDKTEFITSLQASNQSTMAKAHIVQLLYETVRLHLQCLQLCQPILYLRQIIAIHCQHATISLLPEN